MQVLRIPDRRILDLTGRDFKWGGRAVTPVYRNLSAGTSDQTAFRFRNDDGTEATATFSAALSTDLNAGSVTADFDFRLRIQTSCGGSSDITLVPTLYVVHNAEAEQAVTGASTRLIGYNSANVTDEGATTEQLAGANPYTAGKMSEDGVSASMNLPNENDTEHEFTLRAVYADMAAGVNTYVIRLKNNNVAYDQYTVPDAQLTLTKAVAGGQGNRPVVGGSIFFLWPFGY